jgi:hypothetical protein
MKLSTMRKAAIGVTKWRGHNVKWFKECNNVLSGSIQIGQCATCGKCVSLVVLETGESNIVGVAMTEGCAL